MMPVKYINIGVVYSSVSFADNWRLRATYDLEESNCNCHLLLITFIYFGLMSNRN